jgi:hypothetical protein
MRGTVNFSEWDWSDRFLFIVAAVMGWSVSIGVKVNEPTPTEEK